jgi:hypothetical protein
MKGSVDPGQAVVSGSFDSNRNLEQGSVPFIKIFSAPTPHFRFWSGSDGQYLNVLAGDGHTVTKDTSAISEVTGNSFRVTVDGGVGSPTKIRIKFYGLNEKYVVEACS